MLALYEPGSYEIVPHDTMRRFIAERLTLSKQTIPHFYLAIDCQLDALVAARARLNALAPQEGPRAFKLSLNDFIIKALAMALQTVPGRQRHLDGTRAFSAIAPPTSPSRSRSKAAACIPR